jgi:hypothetical protein
MNMAKGGSGKGGTPMTQAAAARIQSTTAKAHGGGVPANSFAARAQSTAATNSGAKGSGSGSKK